MTTLLQGEPAAIMTDHLAILRGYVRGVFTEDQRLDSSQECDKERRFQEFVAIGASFGCTPKELVMLLYQGMIK